MSDSEDKKIHVKVKKEKQKRDAPVNTITKERKKKGKQEAGSPEVQTSVKDSGGGEVQATRKKEKKTKKNGTLDDHLGADMTPVDEPNGSVKNRKKRKRDLQDDTAKTEPNFQLKKRSRKSQENLLRKETSPEEQINGQSDEVVIREKKRKDHKTSLPGGTIEKKRKKRRNKTGFPDPEDDTNEASLTDQSQKALSYAFSKFHKPDLWKFQKARQNWLIRNFWSTKSIPDEYEDLVIKYLSSTQGNSRDNLIKTCRTIIDNTQATSNESIKPPESTASSNLGGVLIDTASFDGGQKQTRAQALLRVLEPDSHS